jgi:hypothetical protein
VAASCTAGTPPTTVYSATSTRAVVGTARKFSGFKPSSTPLKVVVLPAVNTMAFQLVALTVGPPLVPLGQLVITGSARLGALHKAQAKPSHAALAPLAMPAPTRLRPTRSRLDFSIHRMRFNMARPPKEEKP